ncbi:hypothetical protein [Pelagibaculum spongiae]|nr:hypothetical protein [Pelagibaculum spongiae]
MALGKMISLFRVKIVVDSLVALEIGLPVIRKHCKLFEALANNGVERGC